MPSIHHELVIGASAVSVYSAITTQEGLSAWWTPDTKFKAQLNSIARFGFGPDYFKEMKIVELVPSKQVKWICRKGAIEWIGTIISFELETGDQDSLLNSHPELKGQLEQERNGEEETLLIFHHDDWKTYSPMYAECNYTWGQFLRSLKLFCETGQGRPWPDQHRVMAGAEYRHKQA